MRLFSMPSVAGRLYPGALFRIRTKERVLFLTFDDGPDPDSTPGIINILDKHNIKAAFFCDGRSAEIYPALVGIIKREGHLIGNHGYNHPDGWSTSLSEYCYDVNYASRFTSDTLFRPPFGHLRFSQYRGLRDFYKIVFWDVMPYDFDKEIDPGKSLDILNKRIRPGSVIALHDRSDCASVRFLDEFLDTSVKRGYRFICPELQ